MLCGEGPFSQVSQAQGETEQLKRLRSQGSRALVVEEEVRLGFPADVTTGSRRQREVTVLSNKGKELGLRRAVRAQPDVMVR